MNPPVMEPQAELNRGSDSVERLVRWILRRWHKRWQMYHVNAILSEMSRWDYDHNCVEYHKEQWRRQGELYSANDQSDRMAGGEAAHQK